MGGHHVSTSTSLVVGARVSWVHLFCAARAYAAQGSTLALDLLAARRAKGTLRTADGGAVERMPVELWVRIKLHAQALHGAALRAEELTLVERIICGVCRDKHAGALPGWHEHKGFFDRGARRCDWCSTSAKKMLRYLRYSRDETVDFLWTYGLAAEGIRYREIPEEEWTQPDDPYDETYVDSQEARKGRRGKKQEKSVEEEDDDGIDSFEVPESGDDSEEEDRNVNYGEAAFRHNTRERLKDPRFHSFLTPLAGQAEYKPASVNTLKSGWGDYYDAALVYGGPLNLDKMQEIVRANTPLYRRFLEDWPLQMELEGEERVPRRGERVPQLYTRVWTR
ncbi:hypothetical protein JCM10450v2_000454 [Rhodotorula kratochvilovae]